MELYSLIHQRYIGSEDGLEDMVWIDYESWKDRKRSMMNMCMVSVLDIIVIIFLFFLFVCTIWIIVRLVCPMNHVIIVISYTVLVVKICMFQRTKIQSVRNWDWLWYLAIDGCFFGTSLPLEFLIHYPSYVPIKPLKVYEPKLYGFSLSKKSLAYRKIWFLEGIWMAKE